MQNSVSQPPGTCAKAAAPRAGQSAGLLRRLAALFYDALLLVAVWVAATLPFVWITDGAPQGTLPRLAFQLYLLAIAFGFFGWFWVHGGQTLGLRAWRLKVVDEHGRTLSWSRAAKRFLAAILSLVCAGIGLLWIMHDRDRRAWHDRLSGSWVVVVPKEH